MKISTNKLIKSVTVLDIAKKDQEEIDLIVKKITKTKNEDELYIAAPFSVKAFIETYPEGQILNIQIDDSNINNNDITEFVDELANLRNYYNDLTVKIIDMTNQISPDKLPEDTIVKKQD